MSRRQLLPPIFILLSVVTALCGVDFAKRADLPPSACLNIFWTAASLWAAVACFRGARKLNERNPRWAWHSFGAGCASWFAGQMLWNVQEGVTGEIPALAGWQDLAFAGTGPCFLTAFYFFSGKNTTALSATRKLCNLVILCCSTAIIILPLCKKIILASDRGLAFLLVVLGGGVLLPSAFLGGILCLWLYTPSRALWPTSLLVAGSGILTAATLQYTIEAAAGAYSPGNLGDYFYLVAFGLIIWAARERYSEGPSTTGPLQRNIHLGYVEPAMSAACILAVLAVVLWRRDDFSSLLSYTVPILGLLAISVGIRDAWSAYIEKRLFEKLRESEQTFRQVVDSNMTGMVFADYSGTLLDANDAFLEIVGYSREELQQGLLNVHRLTSPEFAGRDEASVKELDQRGVCTPYEKEYVRKDGSRVPVLVGRALLPGKADRVVAFVVDLSARKKTEKALQETQARLQAALDHLPFSFYSVDRNGRCVYQNSVAIALLGDQRGKNSEENTLPPELRQEAIRSHERALAGEVVRAEVIHEGGGHKRYYQRIVVPIREGDEITGTFGVNIDRTREKEAQLRLEESETRYRDLAEHSAVGILHFDEAGRTVYANSNMLRMLGVGQPGELAGYSYEEFVTEESRPIREEAYRKLRQGIPSTHEVELMPINGEPLPVLASCVPQIDPSGCFHGSIATFTDLSELKRAQRALESNERRFRALVEHASDGIAAWDAEGIVRYATPSNTRLLGYAPEELLGLPVCDFFHPEDVPAMEEARLFAIQSPETQIPMKARVRHKSGGWRQCEGILTNLLDDPAVSALVVNYHDVTERQQAEDALRESRARLRAFMDNSPTHMFIKDRQGRYELVNKRWLDALGATPEAVLGQTDWEIFPSQQAKTYTASDEQTFASGEPMQFEEIVLEHSEERSSIVQKFPLRNAVGEITALGGIVTDITERVRAEQALRLSEERYRNLVDGARDAIFTISRDAILTSANPGAEQMTGAPNSERVGKPFLPLVAEEDAPKAMETFQSVLAGKRVETVEFMILGADGRRILMEFSATPQYDGDEIVGVLGIGRDITERRALEQQLRHAQRMESVGQLAGGVAHDFNNLLTVIQGNASLIECEDGLAPSVTGCVQQISAAAERAATLTRQLLAFSRRQLIQPRDLDVNKVIGDLAKMLRRLLGEDIRLQFESSANLPLVHADTGMLEQVLLNLTVNARDAMPLGGWLTISTDQVDVSEIEARANPEARAGSFVRISVADTGEGIAPEHLPHVFEPFFTTKDVGKGTGLGLATVYGIVKQHQGWVDIHSTVAEGTRVDIYIPAKAPAMEPAPQSPAAASPMPRGHETVLVVEDEAPLRSMVKLILSRLGYHVLEAASGVEAQVVWSQYRDTIDLVFTDMVMPDGISGQQLVEQLQKDRPDLRVLYTSGYSAQMLARNGRLPDGAYCLQKPYMPPALASAVREALQEAPSPVLAK